MTTYKKIQNTTRRSGVILLLVLAMMTMFAMLIATFLIVTSQQYREAESASKIGRYTDSSPDDDLQQALEAILVGSNSKTSVIRAFSIAENMYGEPHGIHGLTGYAKYGNVSGKNGELQRYYLSYSSGDEPTSLVDWLSTIGNVFTVRNPSDPQKWLSARIVQSGYDDVVANQYYVDVWPIANLQDPTTITGSPTDYNFYINPPAYSGTGAGYVPPKLPLDVNGKPIVDFCVNYIQPRLTAVDEDTDSIPYALQLNPNAPKTNSNIAEFGNLLDSFEWSLNPDYTAPDARSPFLAWIDPKFISDGGNDLGIDPEKSVVIPSYHRPWLVRDWATDFDSMRKVVMRPLPFDHPNFDGSNPPLAYDPTNTHFFNDLRARLADTTGQYLDLDNDGDGLRDSVWLDVGLPVRFNAQGQPYKPLVGILIEDLDGKLNVNAHGNRTDLVKDITNFSYGSGSGPAGVNLLHGFGAMFTSNPITLPDVNVIIAEQLLIGNNGRYADSQKMEFIPRNDVPTSFTNSVLEQFLGLPGFYDQATTAAALGNRVGMLPDYWDYSILFDVANNIPVLDPLGNRYNSFDNVPFTIDPFNTWRGNTAVPLGANDTFPYLFDPNRKTPYDQPFTLSELEAILRNKDGDKDSLPDRLRAIFRDERNMAGNLTGDQLPGALKLARYNTTTMSNDVPVPGPALADQEFSSIFALIRECVRKEQKRVDGTFDVDGITNLLISMLPEEVRQGGKVNLNKLVEDLTMELNGSTPNYENALYERMKLARGIYIILMALSYDKLYGVWETGCWNIGDNLTNPNIDLLEYPNADMKNTNTRCVVYPYIEPSFLEATAINDLFSVCQSAEAVEKVLEAKKISGNNLTPEEKNNLQKARNDQKLFYQVCRELVATRLAQWSINLVEFTDVDAIMTPFIFDVNPFDGDGWGTDGSGVSLFTDEFSRISAAHNNYRLIWGMERPDLLLTETLAFHNRNVADTQCGGYALTKAFYNANSNYLTISTQGDGQWSYNIVNNPDPTTLAQIQNHLDSCYDQIRMPEGSAFLELYCAADPNRPNYPQEIYNGKNLEVSKVNSYNNPIWRVVAGESNYTRKSLSDGQYTTEANMDYSILHNLKKFGEIFSFQLSNPSLLKGSWVPAELKPQPISIDRIVWFTSMKPASSDENTYYNHSQDTADTPLILVPNQYLVVGPRVETFLTSQVYMNTYGSIKDTDGNIICPEINLTNLIAMSSPIGTYKWMVAAAEVSTSNMIPGWGTTWSEGNYEQNIGLGTGLLYPVGIGFSISEPYRSAYYTKPEANRAYFPLETKDPETATYEATVANPQEKVSGNTMPLSQAGLVGNGVAPFYKSAFLQRLADPLRAYDPDKNPYITVDWNMFDLKVYSGEKRDAFEKEEENYFEPSLKEGTATKYFSSRQWGVENTLLSFARYLPNLWDRYLDLSEDIFDDPKNKMVDSSRITEAEKSGVFQAIDFSSLPDTTVHLPYQPSYTVPVDTLAFAQFPVHSLGRLGTDYRLMHPNLTTAPPSTPMVVPMSFVQANTPTIGMGIDDNDFDDPKRIYLGAPVLLNAIPTNAPESVTDITLTTSQHLAWNNAPFANSYEVMQVPASSPGRFGVEFVDKFKARQSTDPPSLYMTNYLLSDQLWATPPDLTTAVEGSPRPIIERSGSLGSNVRFGHLLNFQHAHNS
ncbi:MAG: hypothetical protein LBJ67_16870, partial [Planctomycetaceae bacterium]|nr:hypothetical protein [Planctomycetaceae bacterium]